jgi:hypothetical protein
LHCRLTATPAAEQLLLVERLQLQELLLQLLACLAPAAAGAQKRLGHCCLVLPAVALALLAPDPAAAAAIAALGFVGWAQALLLA